MNFFERMIAFLAPRYAVKRAIAHHSLRAYEGAVTGRRGKGWKAPNGDADTVIAQSLERLRNRSRQLVRDNAYAERAVRTIVSNVVGTGIMSKMSDSNLDKRWQEWCYSRRPDFYGKMDFCGLQALVMRSVVESGEVLIRRRRGETRDDHTSLQILEADFLDTNKTDKTDRIRDGIEFDDNGRVVAYHVFKIHPGARTINFKLNFESVRIPASEIIHLYRTDRPGQNRGVPWAAPVMLRMRDYDDYEDAQLMRQKIAACFVGFVESSEDPATQASGDEQKPLSERFTPGQWEVLGPGQKISFGSPPSVGADYEPYVRRTLTMLAAGWGLSYEALTGDLSQVNFSSGRMGWIEMGRNISAWQWQLMIPNFCEPVKNWWLEGEGLSASTRVPVKLQTTWTPPRREMIDPTKEVPAMKDAIRSGLATLSDSVRQLGYDPDDHLSELESDFKKLTAKNLVLDCDPRNDLKLKQGSGDQNNGAEANGKKAT